jgi:hypothetical protein
MLLSTLREYVESMGGKLRLIAEFPDRSSFVINPAGEKPVRRRKGR